MTVGEVELAVHQLPAGAASLQFGAGAPVSLDEGLRLRSVGDCSSGGACLAVGTAQERVSMLAGAFVLFALMWLAYAESRGLADGLGFPIQVESVRNIDRVFFLGTDGVVWLQDTFLAPVGTVRWYDVVGSMVYYSHFVVPPMTIALLWFVNRHQWVRYMRRFATVILIACTMFVLLPTAPPWMAAGARGVPPPGQKSSVSAIPGRFSRSSSLMPK